LERRERDFASHALDCPKVKQASKADPGRIEIVKILGLREAYSRTKIAKVTFEEFENMTGEVLGE